MKCDEKNYRSPLMASVHETAEALHAAGAIGKQAMREFDDLCLTPVRPLKPKKIRALRTPLSLQRDKHPKG